MGGHIATGSTAGGAFIDVEDCVKGRSPSRLPSVAPMLIG